MKMQSKAFAPFAAKAVDLEARTFEGLASTWDLDLGGDVIHKGAFARTLDHWKANPTRVIPLIDQHRYNSAFDVLGKLVDASETDEGLSAKFEVVPGDDGDRLLARLRGGYLNGLSIGYQAVGNPEYETVTRDDGVKESVRHLREIKLFEVSAVIWGMNPGALIDTHSVKGLFGALSPEEKAELRALLTDTAPAPVEAKAPATEGLAPDDPKRLAIEAALREIQLRNLAA